MKNSNTNYVTSKDLLAIDAVLRSLTFLRRHRKLDLGAYIGDDEAPIRFYDVNGECVGGIDWRTDTTGEADEQGEYVFETTGINP